MEEAQREQPSFSRRLGSARRVCARGSARARLMLPVLSIAKCGWQQQRGDEEKEEDAEGGMEGGREVKIAHPFVYGSTC